MTFSVPPKIIPINKNSLYSKINPFIKIKKKQIVKYSLEAALKSDYVSKILILTDSNKFNKLKKLSSKIEIEKRNESLNNIKIVETMHERKMEMYNNADAFLIFPGGIGTLEEFFEIYSWKQLRLHKKPIFIYNFNDFWRDLFTLLENIIKKDFAGENMKEAYKVINNYSDLTKELEINVEN